METILTSVIGSVVSSAASKWFADKPDTPPPPTVEPPVAMPDPMQDKARARRKTALSMSQQLSAANTVLTGDSKLGG